MMTATRWTRGHPSLAALLLTGLLLAGAALTGCQTPPLDSRLAIRYLGSGRAEVLALVCQGHEVTTISVYENRSEGGGARWAAGPPATGQPRYAEQSHLLRVTLFERPEGWEIREGSLTRLAPGVPYGLSFDSLQGQRSRIRFTLDQLERLDDKVRTGPWSDEQTMSENDFVKAARADCDKQRKDPGDARG